MFFSITVQDGLFIPEHLHTTIEKQLEIFNQKKGHGSVVISSDDVAAEPAATLVQQTANLEKHLPGLMGASLTRPRGRPRGTPGLFTGGIVRPPKRPSIPLQPPSLPTCTFDRSLLTAEGMVIVLLPCVRLIIYHDVRFVAVIDTVFRKSDCIYSLEELKEFVAGCPEYLRCTMDLTEGPGRASCLIADEDIYNLNEKPDLEQSAIGKLKKCTPSDDGHWEIEYEPWIYDSVKKGFNGSKRTCRLSV